MKRFISIFLMISALFSLAGCSQLYNEAVTVDGLEIYVNRAQNRCFVGSFTYDPTDPVTEIVIPDYYDGVPVTEIGGFYGTGVPTPFTIILPINVSDTDVVDGYWVDTTKDVTDILFTLYIGKNVRTIEIVYLDSYFTYRNDDGIISYYRPVLEICCSEENEVFYSKDGKLYFRENDTLVTEFEY